MLQVKNIEQLIVVNSLGTVYRFFSQQFLKISKEFLKQKQPFNRTTSSR